MKRSWFLNLAGLHWITVMVAKCPTDFKLVGTVKEEVALNPSWGLSCLTSALFPWMQKLGPCLWVVVQLCSPVDQKITDRCARVSFVPLISWAENEAQMKLKLASRFTSEGVTECGRTKSWIQVSHFPTPLASSQAWYDISFQMLWESQLYGINTLLTPKGVVFVVELVVFVWGSFR